jgi:hypothetical protein
MDRRLLVRVLAARERTPDTPIDVPSFLHLSLGGAVARNYATSMLVRFAA